MTLTLKERRGPSFSLHAESRVYSGGSLLSTTQYDSGPYLESRQMTWSEGHPWLRNQGIRDNGGPFETIRIWQEPNYDVRGVYSWGQTNAREADGNIFPVRSNAPSFKADASEASVKNFVPSLGDSTLGVMGATAISRVAPTSPTVDGSVAVGELLREGLPSLVGAQLFRQRRLAAKELGGEYLNLQFGILPLWSDIKKAAKAIIDSEAIIKQLLRDSGKNVRRSYRFPLERTITSDNNTSTSAFPWPTLTSAYWTNTVPPIVHRTLHREVWFDGCFTYYLDPEMLKGIEGAAAQARLLFGVKFTPDVFWNLTPWSWLIDWFVNTGPFLKNLGLFSNDGLTLRYGYTMEHVRVTEFHSFPTLTSRGRGWIPNNPSVTLQGERKIRRTQSPFVLGLLGSGLTTRQQAILLALGAARS